MRRNYSMRSIPKMLAQLSREGQNSFDYSATQEDPMQNFAQVFGGAFFGGLGGFGSFARPKQDEPVVHELPVALEEIYKGCTKKIRITKEIVSNSGSVHTEDKVLSITVKQGCESGTQFTFPKEGAIYPNRIPADIVFIVHDEPHALFRRQSSDICYTHTIALRDALCGVAVRVPSLEGDLILLNIDEVIKPGTSHRIPNRGLPNARTGKRGDLVVMFDIQFPMCVSPTEKLFIYNSLPPIQ